MPRIRNNRPDLIRKITEIAHLPQGKGTPQWLTREQLFALYAWMLETDKSRLHYDHIEIKALPGGAS